MMLFKSTAVHIPLLGQCCFFNVSASCLWVFRVFFWGGGVLLKLNLTDHTLLSLPPPPSFSLASPCIASLTDFFCKELFLIFLKLFRCDSFTKGSGSGREGKEMCKLKTALDCLSLAVSQSSCM